MSWLKKVFGSSPPAAPAEAALPGERVLVAEDSITIQKVVEMTLANQGCAVTVAGTAPQALAAMDSQARPMGAAS